MKTIFVGNKPTYDYFLRAKPNWDWQMPIVRIDDGRDQTGEIILDQSGQPMYPGLWTFSETGAIDMDNTSIVIISDEFYQSARQHRDQAAMENFLAAVFSSTQFALTLIVNYFPGNKTAIESDLMQYAGNQRDGNLGAYYWVNQKSALPDIDGAIKRYVNSPDADQHAVQDIVDSEGLTLAPVENDVDENVARWTQDTEEEERQFTNNYGKLAQVLCCTSSKGGSGKTTMTFGIGAWLAASSLAAAKSGQLPKELKICIMDLDVRDAQIGSMIGKSDPTIMKIATEPNITQEVVSKNLCYSDRMKCWFLLSPKLPSSADTIPISKFADTIDTLRYMFDVVILDTSVNYTDPLFNEVAYPRATKIVLVTTLARNSVIGMGKWIIKNGQPKSVGGYGLPLDKVDIVINRGAKGVNMTVKEINKLIDIALTKVYSQLDRTLSPEDWKRPKLVGAVPEIADSILVRLGNIQQFELSLGIPAFEASIGQIARAVMPPQFQDKLPAVHPNS